MLAFLAILVILAAFSGGRKYLSQSPSGNLERAWVERVVDGDTLIVSVDGERERVRLIGVNTPESVHPDPSRNTAEGVEASEFTKSILESGDQVYLEKDVSDRDQYDRLLRYVWLEEPEGERVDRQQVEEKMLNGILVAEGYAEAREYPPDTKYAALFEAIALEPSLSEKNPAA